MSLSLLLCYCDISVVAACILGVCSSWSHVQWQGHHIASAHPLYEGKAVYSALRIFTVQVTRGHAVADTLQQV